MARRRHRFNTELQQRVLDGAEVITCRPADLLTPEVERLTTELKRVAATKSLWRRVRMKLMMC